MQRNKSVRSNQLQGNFDSQAVTLLYVCGDLTCKARSASRCVYLLYSAVLYLALCYHMFVKRATFSRCMSLFQTVTCTSSVSDDNAFVHVLFPAQPKEAVPLSFRRPCPVILPWGSQLLPLISFPSSYLHLPIFYLVVSYLLFPHYIIVLTHNTLIPPHASRRWVWEPLEADKFNVERRDTHYMQERIKKKKIFAKQGD